MDLKTNGANNSSPIHLDKNIIAELVSKYKELDIAVTDPEWDEKKQNYKIDTLLRYNKMVHNFKKTKIFHLLIDSYLKIKSLTSKKRQY